jgi:hypothetical protein
VQAKGAQYNSLLEQLAIAAQNLSLEELQFVLMVAERECARSD